MRKIKTGLLCIFFFLLIGFVNGQETLIIDHTSTVINDIPVSWLDSAKQKLHIGYGHTSHGTQLATGMNALESFFTDGRFDWSHSDEPGSLHMFEGNMWSQDGWLGMDCGTPGWDDETREYLDAHPECNVIIWSWCGIVNTVLDRDVLSDYLEPMSQLELEYPGVKFVYMTGPLDGLGPNGAVKRANDSIRDYCTVNNKILYDFADIEKYDPDRTVNYQEYGGDDECNYDPDGTEPYDRSENWAANWVSQNLGDTLTQLTNTAVSDDCSFGHTHCLNCIQKAIAAWHLWARLAGWEDTTSVPDTTITPFTTSFTADYGTWNTASNWDNGLPDSIAMVIIPDNKHVNVSTSAICSTLTVHPEAKITVDEGITLVVDRLSIKSRQDESITGKIINHGFIEVKEDASVERFIRANKWNGISPSISSLSSEDFNAQDEELYYWDVSEGSFKQITENNHGLNVMQGYLYRNQSADTLITFKGSLNQGMQNFDLNINIQDEFYKGWNFIGNPYLGTIDWDADGWNKASVAGSFYQYNKPSDQPCTYLNGMSVPEGCTDGLIDPMQAFWIYGEEEGTISLDHNVLVSQDKKMPSNTLNDVKSIRLQLSNGSSDYENLIIFNETATHGFDPDLDAFHFPIPIQGESYTAGLYSLDESKKYLTINSIPDDGDFQINLGYSLSNSGEYTFSALEINNIDDTVYLVDSVMNKQVDLSKATYTFTAASGVNNQRFILTTKIIADTTTSVFEEQLGPFNVYSYHRVIYIVSEEPLFAKVKVIDLLGKVVYDEIIDYRRKTAVYLEERGYFIIILQTQKNTYSYKVVLY